MDSAGLAISKFRGLRPALKLYLGTLDPSYVKTLALLSLTKHPSHTLYHPSPYYLVHNASFIDRSSGRRHRRRSRQHRDFVPSGIRRAVHRGQDYW